jgi:hypothetical protein
MVASQKCDIAQQNEEFETLHTKAQISCKQLCCYELCNASITLEGYNNPGRVIAAHEP